MKSNWYTIDNVDEIDSPSVVIFSDRVKNNVDVLKSKVADTKRLRPHVKTHKSANISKMLLDAGITKFKCATIAEAEMLAMAGSPDVLLAYQPVGPKVERLANLAMEYPGTVFSCLVDSLDAAKHINKIFAKYKLIMPVYIDLNVGMNRTGINADAAEELYLAVNKLSAIEVTGLHAYDGHIRESNLALRTEQCNAAFEPVQALADKLQQTGIKEIKIVAGGSTTFSIHATRKHVECSPGTFIYWDAGYQTLFPEYGFEPAAVVVSRIISLPSDDTICIDLGHKSIASENSIDKRVQFLNAPGLVPIGHSEEHMILRHQREHSYAIGDVLYGIPYHVCPTIALYDAMMIVEKGHAIDRWAVTARGRRISL